jgi:hypothetical protein
LFIVEPPWRNVSAAAEEEQGAFRGGQGGQQFRSSDAMSIPRDISCAVFRKRRLFAAPPPSPREGQSRCSGDLIVRLHVENPLP